MIQQATLQFPFEHVRAQRKELKVVGIFNELLGQFGLCGRKGA
jgi:hypothetical protein